MIGSSEVQQEILQQVRLAIGSRADAVIQRLLLNGVTVGDVEELYETLDGLGADKYLLAAVGSWGDTLDPESVLELLQDWNRQKRSA